MKISKHDALRALIDLGIAFNLGWPVLQIGEQAAKAKPPSEFLEQHQLRRSHSHPPSRLLVRLSLLFYVESFHNFGHS